MITVNLTTTRHRIGLCRIALTSLALQSQRPDRINLWISREPYLRDDGIKDQCDIQAMIESLPKTIEDMLRVRWVANTGPYRKLIPILREATHDDVIVTADDDIFYGENWLRALLSIHETAGGLAVAARVRRQRKNFVGVRMSYFYWALMSQAGIAEDDFVITFGGGAVLRRAMFREIDIGDDAFLEVAPTADDLWYSRLLNVNGVGVVVEPSIMRELHFIKHEDGLMERNLLRPKSFTEKMRARLWDRGLGFFGLPVCANDRACASIENYFKYRDEPRPRMSPP